MDRLNTDITKDSIAIKYIKHFLISELEIHLDTFHSVHGSIATKYPPALESSIMILFEQIFRRIVERNEPCHNN